MTLDHFNGIIIIRSPRFQISTKYTSWLDLSEIKLFKNKNEEKFELFKNLEPVEDIVFVRQKKL